MNYYVVINGSLGSGKSTNAEELAKKLKAKRIEFDAVLHDNKLDLHEDCTASIPISDYIKAIDIILPTAKKLLENGDIVIMDGCLFHQEALDYLLQNLKFDHFVFTLKVPLEICIKRDNQRKKTIGANVAKEVYDLVCNNNFGIVIDATKSLRETQNEILSYLP